MKQILKRFTLMKKFRFAKFFFSGIFIFGFIISVKGQNGPNNIVGLDGFYPNAGQVTDLNMQQVSKIKFCKATPYANFLFEDSLIEFTIKHYATQIVTNYNGIDTISIVDSLERIDLLFDGENSSL